MIVETDNLGRDHPNETFLNLPSMDISHAVLVAEAINSGFKRSSRHWLVVEDDYKLELGFEP